MNTSGVAAKFKKEPMTVESRVRWELARVALILAALALLIFLGVKCVRYIENRKRDMAYKELIELRYKNGGMGDKTYELYLSGSKNTFENFIKRFFYEIDVGKENLDRNERIAKLLYGDR